MLLLSLLATGLLVRSSAAFDVGDALAAHQTLVQVLQVPNSGLREIGGAVQLNCSAPHPSTAYTCHAHYHVACAQCR